LLIQTITFEPHLPDSIQQLEKRILGWATLSNLQWNMQAHFGEKIFWLHFSQASIIQEMYDHSTADYKGYALKVF
jgi:monoamine oxidase